MRISVLVSALLFCVFVSTGSAELSRAEQYYLEGKWAKAAHLKHKAHYNLGRSYIALDMHEEGIKSLKLYLKCWDKSLSGAADAPSRSVVKDEIAVLKDIIKYGEEEEDGGY